MAPVKGNLHSRQVLADTAKKILLSLGPELTRRSVDQLMRRGLTVNHTQSVTLGIIVAYTVIIAILWNLPYVRWSLWPFKMLTIAFHEFGHASAACLTGGKVKSISLDPREGGVTHMAGGISIITLPAGYLGSSFIGALLIFCGFNTVASKIASLSLGICFLLTLWWARKDWLTIITILLTIGLLVACWFISHAEGLRFVVLFIGVMSALYSVWDICDDLILRKVNSSDASVFAQRYGGTSQCWGVLWSIVSLIFMVGGIVAGIVAFPESTLEQKKGSDAFLPTL
ncbi:hypothetical protein K3495_g4027 [Podosphaera aphanis]|nr:hypothetical protein K3495_g4027 [Podosphaera aphanis]